MNIQKINGDDIRALGFPKGIVIGFALNKIEKYYRDYSKEEVLEILKNVLQSPADFLEDAQLAEIANELIEKPKLVDGI
ncbi:MAG: RtcB family protein, partial [Bacteroidia bacterium]